MLNRKRFHTGRHWMAMGLLLIGGQFGCEAPVESIESPDQLVTPDPDMGGEPLPSFLSRENPIYGINGERAVERPGQSGPGKAGLGNPLGALAFQLGSKQATATHGGSGGSAFDWPLPDASWRLGWIYMKTGKYVDSIEVWWVDKIGNYHYAGKAGGSGGFGVNYPIDVNGEIYYAEGRSGNKLDAVKMIRFVDDPVEGGGTGGVSWFEPIQHPRTYQGFFGRSGQVIDRLGFYTYLP